MRNKQLHLGLGVEELQSLLFRFPVFNYVSICLHCLKSHTFTRTPSKASFGRFVSRPSKSLMNFYLMDRLLCDVDYYACLKRELPVVRATTTVNSSCPSSWFYHPRHGLVDCRLVCTRPNITHFCSVNCPRMILSSSAKTKLRIDVWVLLPQHQQETKVIWQKAASNQPDCQEIGKLGVFWVAKSLHIEQDLDPFSRFCTALPCNRQTDWLTDWYITQSTLRDHRPRDARWEN